MTDTVDTKVASQEVYGLYGTWPRFRFAERDIGAKWEVVAAVDDASLSRGGFKLAGQIRDASELDEQLQPELAALLRERELSTEADARLSALLECCPFVENVPPIDVDPQNATPEETVAFAAAFDAAWRAAGLGTIQWFKTGGRGLHGKPPLPPGVRSGHLMRAYGGLIRKVAYAANLPLLSNFRSKDNRPPILIDDTLFDRDASGRGGLWRLEGALHSKTGQPKVLATGLPTDPPTWTEALVARLQQSLSDLDQYSRTGELRRKPRERSESRLPKPLTELQERRLLTHLSEQIQQLTPPEGMRHDFRKALIGWLLREGVPARVAGATVAVAGDPQDAMAAAKTTASRLAAGRNAYGFRKLLEIVGQGGGLALRAALHRDLREANVKPKDLGALPTDSDRATLREAARLADAAGFATRAKGLRRAARCGMAKGVGRCKRCHAVQGCRHLISERATCPHCAQRRAVSVLNWCMTKWPGRLWIVTRKLADDTLECARTERKRWMRKLRAERRTNVRWIIAPGWLVAITHDMLTGAILQGWTVRDGWAMPDEEGNDRNRFSVVKVLAPVVRARALHLREHLDSADPKGLAEDAWCDKVMEASGGATARTMMPWPKKKDLRLMAVNASRARQNLEPLAPGATFPSLRDKLQERTVCCESRIDHEVRDAKTDELIAVRDDRPWSFAEGSVRAENGWRGEELRFNEAGEMIVQILPTGWDETKLRE